MLRPSLKGLREAEIHLPEAKTLLRTSLKGPQVTEIGPQVTEIDPQEAEIDPQDLCKALEKAKTAPRTLKTSPPETRIKVIGPQIKPFCPHQPDPKLPDPNWRDPN
tara:strand:- start:169 stop:486 length:318 start_codon:yes stop_codon:yes gene_type:complete